MKKLFVFALALSTLLTACCSKPADDGTPDAQAAAALANRIIPLQADQFTFKTLPADTCDFFTLGMEGRKIAIGGNNANSMAVGLND